MPNELNRTMAEILKATGDVPQERLEQLLETVDDLDAGTPGPTLDQILVKEKLLHEEKAAKVRQNAEEVLKAPKIAGYSVLCKLGEGGMGAVYKARQDSMGREVALKILPAHRANNPAFVDRFYREARTSGKLNHPNVVQGIDVGEAGGVHYFAMEFVDGKSLQQVIDEYKRLAVPDALKVIRDVALALVHAQELHMIHRDIKPDNIMVTKKGVVKLTDLGLAKVTDEEGSLTQTGSGFGTPYYMAPEQAKDAKYVDGRSDIYALGATLYRILAGQVPFPGETPMQVLLKKEQGTFPKVSSHNPEVPSQVNLLIDKMMAKAPDHRHQTAMELVEELDRLGLHGDRLSFIAEGASSAGSMASAAGRRTPTPAPSAPKPKAVPTAAAKPARKAGAPPAPAVADVNVWYLRVPSERGKTNKVKLDTARVCELIRKGEVDERAEASHSAKGPFKRLAAYREFEPLLASRVAKKRIEKHSARASVKLSQYVANIEKEERWYRIRKRIREAGNAILTWVLAAVIVIGGGFAIYQYVIKPKLDADTPSAQSQ